MNRRTSLRRRLQRLESAVRPPDPPAPPAPPPAADESGVLASEMALAFRAMVEHYRKDCLLSLQEAVGTATAPFSDQDERTLNGPPEAVSWYALDCLAERDLEGVQRRWEEIKRAAREELRAGHRAARAVEAGGGGPWDRARFLVIRAELSEAWRPRDGLEQQLVDQLAGWQTLLYQWQEALQRWAVVASAEPWFPAGRGRKLEPPRLTESQALQRAAAMAERCQRNYLRVLRALQELRRRPALVVHRARQVNVAGQMVNFNH
jgi:hypothetical protein